MAIQVIASVADNNIISNHGKLPWDIREEREHFNTITLEHPILMGRKTFEYYGCKPLPQRRNIVVSSSLQKNKSNVEIVRSIPEALNLINDRILLVIGGKSLFEQMIPICDILYLTRVHLKCEGDIELPKIDWTQFVKIDKLTHYVDDGQKRENPLDRLSYSFEIWKNKNSEFNKQEPLFWGE